jgi:preprotein translocase subunit SecG
MGRLKVALITLAKHIVEDLMTMVWRWIVIKVIEERVNRSLVLCVCFVDRCLSFCTFSFGHCVVCSSSTYGFWLLFGIFWPLCCMFFFDVRILITLWYLLAIGLSVLLRHTNSDYSLVSFGHCVVCSSSTYGFWLLFGIFWPLCCLFFFDIRILITLWYLLAIVLSVLLRRTDSDYSLVSFGHCVVCSSSTYGFWLLFGIFWPLYFLFFLDIRILITLWYLLAIVLSALLRHTDSDYSLISSNSSC